MHTVHIELSLEQLQQAVRQLPAQEKAALWRLLDSELDRAAIALRFASTLASLRKTYAHYDEAEVMADALKATRAARHAKRRS